jgi:hypothetical protein
MKDTPHGTAERLEKELRLATAGRSASAGTDGSAATAPAPRRAVIEAAFLLAAVDGEVTPMEIAQFAEGVEEAMGAEASLDVEAMVKEMAEQLAKDGWDKRLAALKSALEGSPDGEMAYRLAASVAFVDDTVAHAEAAALVAMASAFGISEERSRALMEEVRRDLFGE